MIRVKLKGPEATAIVDAVMRRQRQRGRVFRRDADLRAIAAAMSACTEDELLDGVEIFAAGGHPARRPRALVDDHAVDHTGRRAPHRHPGTVRSRLLDRHRCPATPAPAQRRRPAADEGPPLVEAAQGQDLHRGGGSAQTGQPPANSTASLRSRSCGTCRSVCRSRAPSLRTVAAAALPERHRRRTSTGR